jgi:photosynthetic reaction center H subunit
MNMTGDITGYIDVAQIVLYLFWIFFAGLIYYLHRENKREGYPLETENGQRLIEGFPPVPAPKTFKLLHGGTATAPNGKRDARDLKAQPMNGTPGAPLVPTGDPMADGVGPASYAQRSDHPERGADGQNVIVPLRSASAFSVAKDDPDPRGMAVIGCDGQSGGTVRDIWIDRGEALIRYLEVDTAGGRRVLLPMNLAKVDGKARRVNVKSILGAQFAKVPGTKSPDQVTLLEEDRIMGFYGGGHLYATPERQEPLV